MSIPRRISLINNNYLLPGISTAQHYPLYSINKDTRPQEWDSELTAGHVNISDKNYKQLSFKVDLL